MRCSKCGSDSPAGKRFCGDCGALLTSSCPRCGTENPPGKDFCGDCGIAVAASGANAQSQTSSLGTAHITISVEAKAPDLAEGERKTVTALFADIKGSMELMEDLDPEEARTIVDPALKLMIDAVHHYNGYVVQSTGDGIFALFGAPVAHEDHPQRALFAALEMQKHLGRYSNQLRSEGRLPLQARVGVNTGEVVVRSLETGEGHAEYTPIGHSMSLSARMQVLAPVGSIAATDATRKLCEGYFTFKPLGPTVVKGVKEQIEVFEVTGRGPLRTRLQRSAIRGFTKFVGREHEMAALRHAAKLAQGGHGQVVAAVAEPGLGKSRLFHEFKLSSQTGWMTREALSVSHGKNSAYLPVLELLRDYFRINATDDLRIRREKVTGRILSLDRALEDTLPYLFGLLGLNEGDDSLAQMDARMRRRRTHEAINRILLRESINQPLMVIFEDLHWIDEQSQELLNLLADSIGVSRVLLLVNYRPEYRHDWKWKTYYTQLRLDPLGPVGAEEMLAALLGDDQQLVPLRRLVIQRTDGNPFFMEEMVQALLEQGLLNRNGSVRLIKPLNEVKLPATVQGVVASRIDRLQPAHKELLQTISIIGREFRLALVGRLVAKPEDELRQALAELQLAEFIYEQPAIGDVEYIFKHALTQEVAYSSVLIEQRREAHEQVGRAIEALYENQVDEHLSELAYHYQRSNNSFKAVDYLKRAAQQAAGRSAISQAESQIRDALTRLSEAATPERDVLELELQTSLAALLISRSFGASEREQPLRRAYDLCERIGNDRETLFVLFQLGQFYIEQARFNEARKLAERAVTLADRVKDPIGEAGAQESLGECCLWTGDLREARPHFERLLELCEKMPSPPLIRAFGFDLSPIAPFGLGIVDLLLGWPERAIQWEQRTIEQARSSGHPYSHALGLFMTSFQRWLRGDTAATSEILIPAQQICEEYGFHEIAGLAKQLAGCIHFQHGERILGIAEMSEAIQDLHTLGSFFWSPLRLLLLAEMQLQSGEIQAAEGLIKEALETLNLRNAGWCAPEVHRVAAQVMLIKPGRDSVAAERYLARAVEIARAQGAKWWELRASISFARLLRDTERRDEARTILADIYNWFTEGFDSAYLKEAKALLEELGVTEHVPRKCTI